MKTHIILYVKDQTASTAFYSQVLNAEPILNVPGMTEYNLSENTILGLMPVTGIKRLLGNSISDPEMGAGIPRAEIYIIVEDAKAYCERTVLAGAKVLSSFQKRDWGHTAAYYLDPDGHVLAFAEDLG